MRLASIVLVLCTFAAVSPAQVGELSLSVGQSIFKNNKLGSAGDLVNQYKVGDGFRIAARFTLNTKQFLGHEFGYAYNHNKLALTASPEEAKMPVHQAFYNILLYMTPDGSRIRPFGTGGGHFSTFVPPGASVTYGTGTTKYGVNYGAGVKVRLTPMFAMRIDLRDYITGKPFDLEGRSGALHQVEASAGFGIFF